MNALRLSKKQRPISAQAGASTMKAPFVISIIFHILVVLGLTIGMPPSAKEPMEIFTPISIEMVDIGEVTQTPKIAAPQKVDKKKPDPPKPEQQEKPRAAPKNTAPAPPDLTQPKPPEVEDVAPIAETTKKPPPLKRKPLNKPEKPKESKVTKKTEAQPKENDFASLLRNLTPEANNDTQTDKDVLAEPAVSSYEETAIARLGDTLTISEMDAIRRQLGQCWNVLSGAKYAENLIVEVRVYMNADRTVNRASILDQGRYNRDAHFRAAADAALRALRNPRCSPLNLPPGKYEQWKTILINFDPRDML